MCICRRRNPFLWSVPPISLEKFDREDLVMLVRQNEILLTAVPRNAKSVLSSVLVFRYGGTTIKDAPLFASDINFSNTYVPYVASFILFCTG